MDNIITYWRIQRRGWLGSPPTLRLNFEKYENKLKQGKTEELKKRKFLYNLYRYFILYVKVRLLCNFFFKKFHTLHICNPLPLKINLDPRLAYTIPVNKVF